MVIKVENVSKSYFIKHQQQRRYVALRDVIADKTSSLFKKRKSEDFLSKEEFWALRNISFDVNQGDRIGIIGKNGAGKSTLLKILSRITEPTEGSVKIKGRVASLLEVGTGFHPELTGRENIFLNGAILGMPRVEIRNKFDEIVDFSGVEKFLDTPVKRYSSGMYVRLAFSVAAHLEPEILVVDEVLAVGDVDFQKKCLGKMEDVSKKEGRTVLFVSHNMTAIKSLCNFGILLNKGEMQETGDIARVVEKYLAKFSIASKAVFGEEGKNEYAALKSIELVGHKDGYFDIKKPLDIRLVLENISISEGINVNLYFNTVERRMIFAACSQVHVIPKGEFTCICHIPMNFLNDNIYQLDVMVVKNSEEGVLHLKDIMTIEGIEPPRSSAWVGKYPGMIRPVINFDVLYG